MLESVRQMVCEISGSVETPGTGPGSTGGSAGGELFQNSGGSGEVAGEAGDSFSLVPVSMPGGKFLDLITGGWKNFSFSEKVSRLVGGGNFFRPGLEGSGRRDGGLEYGLPSPPFFSKMRGRGPSGAPSSPCSTS